MASNTKVLDPAFQGAGQKLGTEIWRIENFEPVPLPKSDHGKFYTGDSYIVLQTSPGKGGAYLFDIHYWIGKDTSQDEAGTAAIKTIELDTILGGRAVQHRELQGHESDKFISYFKPCIIPLEGGVATGFKKYEEEKFETRLYVCNGKRAVKLKQVPYARSSLNHDDVFILDTENKIYQFNGENSNIQERAKALEVIQFFKEKYHDGTCEVAIVDDGNLRRESDSGEFWLLFGGFAPIGKKIASDDDITLERTPGKLYSIADGQVAPVEGSLSKGLLENYKCYLLDCGAEVFVWVGRVTQVEERKAASQAAEEFISSENRPRSIRITRVIQGYETHAFKSNFESWPAGAVASTAEDGRGKVAALLKQQALGAKGTAKATPVNEEVPPLLENGGKLEVWRINGSAKTPVPKEEIGKFYSGDCYIILYTYHAGDKKEDYFLSCWIGKDSIQEEQMMASRLANTMSNSFKGRPVQGRVFQGKEPPQFIAIFQPMVILKGGISSGYRKSIEDKGVNDDSYSTDGVALIRISGTSLHNNKAVQVDTVASSLNSNDCFLLQSGSSVFTWHGNQSTAEQQQLAAKIAEFLKPDVALKYTKEGTESSGFWHALGGKQSYTSKQESQEIVRDPHLNTYSFNKAGKFEVTEIYNFSQDDLLTEDMLILNTQAEVFVWVGQSVDSKEKQKAFEIGQTYIELASALDGLSPGVALYKVTEGNEPCFFTTYFSWDSAKATVQGNSFQKKLASLFGGGHAVEDKSNGSNSGGPTQRASALAALSSAFNPSSGGTKTAVSRPSPTRGSSQRAAAVAALSGVLTAEQKKPSPDVSPSRARGSLARKARDPEETSESTLSEVEAPPEISEVKETIEEVKETVEDEAESVSISENNGEDAEEKQEEPQTDEIAAGSTTFSYDQLRSKSTDPAQGIDFKQREAYLSDEEFQTVLGMTKEVFYKQPKWKQDMQKKKVELF